jgi:hypothetical protein
LFVSAICRFNALRPSHPIPNVRDDRETPLLWARDRVKIRLIWVSEKAKYFGGEVWTGEISLKWLAKIAFWRGPFRQLFKHAANLEKENIQRETCTNFKCGPRQFPPSAKNTLYPARAGPRSIIFNSRHCSRPFGTSAMGPATDFRPVRVLRTRPALGACEYHLSTAEPQSYRGSQRKAYHRRIDLP